LTLNTIRVFDAWYALAMGCVGQSPQPIRPGAPSFGAGQGDDPVVIHVAMAFSILSTTVSPLRSTPPGRPAALGEGVYDDFLVYSTLRVATGCFWWWLQPDVYMRRSNDGERIIHCVHAAASSSNGCGVESAATRWVGLAFLSGSLGWGMSASGLAKKSHRFEQLAPLTIHRPFAAAAPESAYAVPIALPFDYGWINVSSLRFAMTATLPGRDPWNWV